MKPSTTQKKAETMNMAQRQFVGWLKTNYPAMAEQIQNRVDNDQSLAAADTTKKPESIWGSIVSGIKELAPSYLQFKQQKKIMAMQLKRARQGLPPLNVEQFAPTVRVQAGLSPDLKKFLIPGLLAVVGLGIFFIMKKK